MAGIYDDSSRSSSDLTVTLDLSQLQQLTGREGQNNLIAITNVGDEISGGERGDAVAETLEPIVSSAERAMYSAMAAAVGSALGVFVGWFFALVIKWIALLPVIAVGKLGT